MENNRRHKIVWISLVLILALGILGFWAFARISNPIVDDEVAAPNEVYEVSAENGYGVSIRQDESLGDYLAAPNGMTLYATNLEECSEECLNAWLPYIVSAPDAESGEIIGTIARGNAHQQTYRGVPLYFYRLDEEPGDIKGHALDQQWFVARP